MPILDNPSLGSAVQWFGLDTPERYQKNPHPTLTLTSVIYRFNSLGYRCAEFDQANPDPRPFSVVTLGASEALGVGVPEELTVSRLFCNWVGKHLGRPVIDWNLGYGGRGADFMTRTLVSALPVLRPNIVLLLFPHPARREVIRPDGSIFHFNPHGQNSLSAKLLNPEKHMLTEACLDLGSGYNDEVNLFMNWQVCRSLCEQHHVMWLYAGLRDHFFNRIKHLLDSDHWVRPGLGDLKQHFNDQPALALARDMQHPGIAPHERMAEQLFERWRQLYPDRVA
jgi:hypothetical protein